MALWHLQVKIIPYFKVPLFIAPVIIFLQVFSSGLEKISQPGWRKTPDEWHEHSCQSEQAGSKWFTGRKAFIPSGWQILNVLFLSFFEKPGSVCEWCVSSNKPTVVFALSYFPCVIQSSGSWLPLKCQGKSILKLRVLHYITFTLKRKWICCYGPNCLSQLEDTFS